MEAETKISLARMYYPVKTLGPGNRVGIWLNGCDRACIGCISPELQKYDKTKEISVDVIMKMIRTIKAPIDGFTISGGEPFFRPEALNVLVEQLATENDDIFIYTGYTIEELRSQGKKETDSVLNTCAALIDGAYIRELNDNKGLRGSSNQRCFIFKYREKYADIENAERKLQTIVYDGKVVTIGIPGEEVNL